MSFLIPLRIFVLYVLFFTSNYTALYSHVADSNSNIAKAIYWIADLQRISEKIVVSFVLPHMEQHLNFFYIFL